MSFLDLCGAEVVFPEMVRSRVGPPRASLKLLERELGSGLWPISAAHFSQWEGAARPQPITALLSILTNHSSATADPFNPIDNSRAKGVKSK